MRARWLAGVVLWGLFGLWLPLSGQQLRWLGHSSGRPVIASAVSGDGQVVVGSMPVCYIPPEQYRCSYRDHPFRWVVATNSVLDLLADCNDYCQSVARGISFYGDVIVGGGLGFPGFRWDLEVQNFTERYHSGVAFGVSGDGRVVVGQLSGRAFRHVLDQPIELLGTLGGAQSEALDASWDGAVVVGRAQDAQGNWRAFRWTEATGMRDLGVLFSTHWSGTATAVSADGNTVVGWTQGFTARAFRWTPATGLQPLRAFPDGGNTFAQDVSADGRVIVGWAQVGMEERAVRWRASGAIEDLNVAFRSLLRAGEVLRRANGVSADGRYIVGWGERGGIVEAFWLDTRLAGDVNGDGCIDEADLLRVLFAFGQSGSDLPEDTNRDGVVDDADLLSVLFDFSRGCE
ncbi:MAG: hypothetical protein ABDI19_12035 [Armatimonadota bacterium]